MRSALLVTLGAVILTTADVSANAPQIYGRFHSFSAFKLHDVNEPPMCVILYDNFTPWSLVTILWAPGEPLSLSMLDPSWQLPKKTSGSIYVESGNFDYRYPIERNGKNFVVVNIDNTDTFRDVFTANYEMTLHTPKTEWYVDLSGSNNAWNAFDRCVADVYESEGIENERNPSGEPDGDAANPWR